MYGGHGFGRLLRGFRRPDTSAVASVGTMGPGDSSGLLVRTFCHEFRTPINTLAALTQALADERRPLSSDDRRAIAALARDQAAHLQGLLGVAADNTSSLTLVGHQDEQRVPLAEILSAVTVVVPPERRRIRVTRRAAACRVPQRRTRQVLANLVENALRHGPPEGPVGIYAARRRSGLSVTVTDEGCVEDGLVEALRRPVPAAGMSGLGLWIARQLVAADGGRVCLHRLRPRGVALEVLLPGPPSAG